MKHFLHISDYSDTELWEILHLAKDLKAKFHERANFKHFKNRSLAKAAGLVQLISEQRRNISTPH